MKKRSFSIKKDLGRKVRYVAINAMGAAKPNITMGRSFIYTSMTGSGVRFLMQQRRRCLMFMFRSLSENS